VRTGRTAKTTTNKVHFGRGDFDRFEEACGLARELSALIVARPWGLGDQSWPNTDLEVTFPSVHGQDGAIVRVHLTLKLQGGLCVSFWF